MDKNKLIKQIPNLLSGMNLSLGIAAILILTRAEYMQVVRLATALILLGGIADFFDGYAARRLDAVTDMGKQLDSFADLVTFGIAPIALVNRLAPEAYEVPLAIVSLVYVLAGAYRLARYNLHTCSRNYVMGLPITIAGVVVAVYAAAYFAWGAVAQPRVSAVLTGVLLGLLAVLMVSRKKRKRRCGGFPSVNAKRTPCR